MTRDPEKRLEKGHLAADTSTHLSRRSFLAQAWWWLLGLAVVEYLVIAFDLLKPRRVRSDSTDRSIFVAGPVERFSPGTVTAFPRGRFYLARLADGGFLALSRRCTHLGCTVPWDDRAGKFVCPCHASSFDITGRVTGPPAPRALDIYPVRIENGVVKVDIGRLQKRRDFNPADVTRA